MIPSFLQTQMGEASQFGLKNQLRSLGMNGGQVTQAFQKLGLNDLLNQQQAQFQAAEEARKQAEKQQPMQPTMIPRETGGRRPRVNTIGRNDMETRKWGGTGLGGTTLMPNAAYGGLSYGRMGESDKPSIMGATNAQSSIGTAAGGFTGDPVYSGSPVQQPGQGPSTSLNALRRGGFISPQQMQAARKLAQATGQQFNPNAQMAVPGASLSNYMNQFLGM